MKSTFSKEQAIKIIKNAAERYDNSLNNKDLLIITKEGKRIENYILQFQDSNFMHFTGVQSNFSPSKFFHAVLQGELSINDFDFKDNFLAEKKMRILEKAVDLPLSARMIGNFNYAGIKLQADIGAGSPSFVMAFRYDDRNKLYPVSVLEEDIRNCTQPTSPVFAILRKNMTEKMFREMTYLSKTINKNNIFIPKDYDKIITPDVLRQLRGYEERI